MALFRAKNQAGYESWRLRVNPQVIEYARAVLDEIMETVATAQASVPQGGFEVGGLLYGAGDKHLVRILATRPISCEHAYGPQFLLSERDHERLVAQFAEWANDPELKDLVPVGWYVSRVRGEIALRESDRQAHSRHFPETWQIALVFRQGPDGDMAAGLFARGKDPLLPSEPMRLVEGLGSTASRWAAEPEPADCAPEDIAPTLEDAEPLPFHFSAEQAAEESAPHRRHRMWIGVLLALVLAAALAATGVLGAGGISEATQGLASYWQRVTDYWTAPPSGVGSTPLALQLGVLDDQITLRWRGDAAVLQQSSSATLVVRDGAEKLEVPLEGDELSLGSMTYRPLTANVVASLRVPTGDGTEIVETARLVGQPRLALQADDDLEAEVERLGIALRLEQQEGESLLSALRALESAPPAPAPAAEPPSVQQNQPTLIERPPQQPVVLEQRPAAAPHPASPALSQSSRAGTVAESGTLIWSGLLEPGDTLRIESGKPSTGSLIGAFPGNPIRVRTYPAEMASNGLTVLSGETRFNDQIVIEEAGPRTQGQRVIYRYDPGAARSISVAEAPAAANGWNRIVVRAGDQPLSVIFIRWETAR